METLEETSQEFVADKGHRDDDGVLEEIERQDREERVAPPDVAD